MVQDGCETLTVQEDATHNYLNIEDVPLVETTQVFHVNEGGVEEVKCYATLTILSWLSGL